MGPASFALSPRSITSVKRLVMSKYEVTFANGSVYVIEADGKC